MTNTQPHEVYNRRKYEILLFTLNADTVTAVDLIHTLKIKNDNARMRLSKLYRQNYLIKNKRGVYRLSVKGVRILKQLQERSNLEKETGKDVSFNLRKSAF
ncbi:MAG: hypothetical protein OIN86_04650 [Candidatus Methanoperedens sp.]|nr:hypothetical protein [Candidatus Methanoperedens sp.]CAG0996685.1 hypothetical protein METP1_02613 [Methanosarcinales archaeon]